MLSIILQINIFCSIICFVFVFQMLNIVIVFKNIYNLKRERKLRNGDVVLEIMIKLNCDKQNTKKKQNEKLAK